MCKVNDLQDCEEGTHSQTPEDRISKESLVEPYNFMFSSFRTPALLEHSDRDDEEHGINSAIYRESFLDSQ